jgi:hypothetical protein
LALLAVPLLAVLLPVSPPDAAVAAIASATKLTGMMTRFFLYQGRVALA